MGIGKEYVTRRMKPSEVDEAARVNSKASSEKVTGLVEEEHFKRAASLYREALKERQKLVIVTVHKPTNSIVSASAVVPFSFVEGERKSLNPGELDDLNRAIARKTDGKKERKTAFMTGMAVASGHQNRGLSLLHLAQREEWARKNGFTHSIAHTSPDNAPEALGEKPSNIKRLENHGYELIYETKFKFPPYPRKYWYLKSLKPT